jgi:hypothetical protein
MERRNNAVAERQFNLVSLETLKFEHEPWSLENYRKIGGYESWNSWQPAMAALTPSLLFLAAAAGMLYWVERR